MLILMQALKAIKYRKATEKRFLGGVARSHHQQVKFMTFIDEAKAAAASFQRVKEK